MRSPRYSPQDVAFMRAEARNGVSAAQDAPDAVPAKKCQCEPEQAWLERDEDGALHCARCGRDWSRS